LNAFKNALRIKKREVEDPKEFSFKKDMDEFGMFNRRHGKTDSFSSLDENSGIGLVFAEKRNNSISKSFETIL